MGSYGIGISRIPAAMIEVSNDERGIYGLKKYAPFDVIIVDLISKKEKTNFVLSYIIN